MLIDEASPPQQASRQDAPAAPSRWLATWVTGPAAGRSIRLGAGRHVVGRSALADVRCDDRNLEPFHVAVEVAADGSLELVQLAARLPVTVDGRLAGTGALALPADAAHTINVGASQLVLRHAPQQRPRTALQLGAAVAGRPSVVRAGRVVPTWAPTPVAVPEEEQPRTAFAGSVLPALLGLAGAGVIAAVLNQPMFLLFGALGAVVALATWAAQRVGLIRSRRRSSRALRKAIADFESGLDEQRRARIRHHRASVGTLTRAVATAADPDSTLWARRSDHPDAFTVSLGVGEVTWQPSLAGDERSLPPNCWSTIERARTLADDPVPLTVGPGVRVALCGPHAAAVAASLLAQLAVQVGPADWRLMIVTADSDLWEPWTRLPHARDESGASAVLDEQAVADSLRDARQDGADDRHLVVVVDDVRMLAARTSPVRRLIAAAPAAALLVVVDAESTVPALCTSLLSTCADGRASWTADTTTGDLPQPLRLAGLAPADAAALTSALAAFSDPEDPASAADALVGDVPLTTLLDHVDPASIAAAWLAAGADVAPETPVGVATDGVVTIDLVRDGPHALVAGTTGAGKSELLRSLVVGLAARLGPDQINFVLVDYKGGAAFDVCAPLPHVVGLVTDLDHRLTERALRSLRAELTRREHLMREHGATDLPELRAKAGEPVMPRLVVVVDEFAAMAVDHGDFLHALIGVAQRGRSLGVHLILATQRPAGVISDDIRANTNLRIALRLNDASDALDVIGDGAATNLPRHRPGRALMRLGPDELIEFQSAHQTASLVPAIVEAARAAPLAPSHRPWCEPLPSELPAAAVPAGAIGLLDLPDLQQQVPWTWTPADGHVIVAGAHGSGVTSTLVQAVLANAGATTAFAVLDARGDDQWDELADHPRCAGVVRLHERERLIRMIASHGSVVTDGTARMLVVDGIAALRLELEPIELSETRATFERLLSDASLGVTLVVGTDAPAAVPPALVTRCANKWVHHLPEARDAVAFGIPAALVPSAPVPGRVAVTRGRNILEAQVACPDRARLRARPDLPRVERVGTLPSFVDASALGRPAHHDGVLTLPVGLRFDTCGPAGLDVADGEHVLVIGPGRSGRSTVLVRLMRAWMEAHPDGWVGVIAPRRSPLSPLARDAAHQVVERLPAAGAALLVVDDAELMDDPSGALARLVGSRRPGLLVVAAGRPESLRAAYGHWSAGVRRSRLGMVMAGATDMDADVLGAVLPRWAPIPPRPGLGHLVADGTETLVQCALDVSPAGAAAAADASTRIGGRRRSTPRSLVAVS